MSRETVIFNQTGPNPVNLEDNAVTSSRTGCYVITLTFAQPTQVGEITFRNFYTWAIGVHILHTSSASPPGIDGYDLAWQEPGSWQVGIKNKIIMPHPHTETASQSMVSITCLESRVEWQELAAVRLILRQPSPVWKTFYIEDITVYRELPRLPPYSITLKSEGQEKMKDGALEKLIQQTLRALKVSEDDDLEGELSNGYEISALQHSQNSEYEK